MQLQIKKEDVLACRTAVQWRSWLVRNHENQGGIWLQIFKKASGVATVTYAQALDEALCFGWIDGQKKRYDDQSFLQKFTPRRPRSVWSKRNREHVARLTKEKRMTPTGLKEVEAAKADGRWEAAYDSSKNMAVPDDLLKVLAKHKKSALFFESLNKANRYAILWRLQTAKTPETRKKRMDLILEMLKNGKTFH